MSILLFCSVVQIYFTVKIKNFDFFFQVDIDIVQGMHSVMSSDALASSHPLNADVETRQEVSSIFDAVTYTKASRI